MEVKQKMNFLKEVLFDSRGLVPVIIQDIKTNEVLMHAWMNEEALRKTVVTEKTYFWSRSRKRLWLKGESSGHYQLVKEIYIDCDRDTLLIKVEQIKGACHLGYKSCFFRKLIKKEEWKTVKERVFEPKEVYSSSQN